MSGIVVTDRPTKEIMEAAHRDKQMVITFLVQPEFVNDYKTGQAFQAGWLAGLGLEPDHRLALVVIPKNVDFDHARQVYLTHLDEAQFSPPSLTMPFHEGFEWLPGVLKVW